MIELCRTAGQKLLFEGNYDHAVPAALAALKFAIQVYGLSSIELVPSYLILGEASIGKMVYMPHTGSIPAVMKIMNLCFYDYQVWDLSGQLGNRNGLIFYFSIS